MNNATDEANDGAAILPSGSRTTRPDAMDLLKRGSIDFFLSRPSGQISTTAREIGVSVVQRKASDGLVRVQRGTPRRKVPTGLEAPTASLVSVLNPRERAELKRLLGKLLADL